MKKHVRTARNGHDSNELYCWQRQSTVGEGQFESHGIPPPGGGLFTADRIVYISVSSPKELEMFCMKFDVEVVDIRHLRLLSEGVKQFIAPKINYTCMKYKFCKKFRGVGPLFLGFLVGLCVDRNASDSVSRRAAVWLVDIDK